MMSFPRFIAPVVVVGGILLGNGAAAAQVKRPATPCPDIIDAAEGGQSRDDIRSLASCAGRGGEATALRLWNQPPRDWRALEALALASGEIRSPELLHRITTVVRSESADRATRLAAIAAVVSRADSRVLLLWRSEYPFGGEDRPAREYAFVGVADSPIRSSAASAAEREQIDAALRTAAASGDQLVAKIASYVLAELGYLPR
jgi:hypothetical protein